MILIRKRVYSYKFSFVIRDFNEESRLRRQQTNLVKQLESSEEEDDIVLEKVYVKKKTKTDDSPQEHSDIFFFNREWDSQTGSKRYTGYTTHLFSIGDAKRVKLQGSLFFWTENFLEDALLFPVFLPQSLYPISYLMWCCSGTTRGWRNIRGYPIRGQRTHSNAKSSRKNRELVNFISDGFKVEFGNFKKSLYPTLILAEFNNTLWYFTWFYEWFEASFFVKSLASGKNNNKSTFNPLMLASGQVNGFTRTGKAAKKGKGRRITKVFTIGVPLFFSRWVFYETLPDGFNFKLRIAEQVRRVMSKKKNQFAKTK